MNKHNCKNSVLSRLITSDTSLLLNNKIPNGDRRLWALTLNDLIAGFFRDGDCSKFSDAQGNTLQIMDVENAIEKLNANGLGVGDVVLVYASSNILVVSFLLALWLKGCCICPVDPASPLEVLSMIAKESRSKAVIRKDGTIEHLHARESYISLQRNIIKSTCNNSFCVTGSDLAMVIFTSGSSGNPKGVMLSHQNIMSALRSISSYLGLNKNDIIFVTPPLFFDYGLYQLLFVLFEGCRIIIDSSQEQKNVFMLAKQVERKLPTVLPIVPALAFGLARMFNITGKTLSSVRLITNTGGHLSDKTIEELEKAFPNAQIIPMYGLTECKRALFLNRERYPGHRDCVGRPMLGLEAAVVVTRSDNNMQQRHIANSFEVGELYVRGSSVMQGYHSNNASGGARIEPGEYRDDNWLATGDLFSMDNKFLAYFYGRSNGLIKQGGYCIYPHDIEKAAENIDGVVAVCVVARKEESGDESAIMFIQVDNYNLATIKKKALLLKQLKLIIPRTIMPRQVHFIEEWPATSNGKIDMKQLIKIDAQFLLASSSPSILL